MALSDDLISQLVKATKPTEKKPTEGTIYGTVVDQEGGTFVQLDGSGVVTPVTSTVKVKPGERVIVNIKNHTATVTGNLTTRAARSDDVDDIVDEIADFEIVIADKVSAGELDAANGRIDNLVSDNVLIRGSLTAVEATIDELEADNVVISEKLTANEAAIEHLEASSLTVDIADLRYATIGDLDAINGVIYNLDSTYATIVDLDAAKASIKELEANTLTAEEADIKYANIDFSNIDKATMEWFYANSGLIENVVVGDGTITGYLVGVTIRGDLFEANTIVADKLVIRGEDGLYYKLNTNGVTTETEQTEYNSLNGSIITAKSITATQISVSDLVAFDATIGGFTITENAIYSEVKDSEGNMTRGVYLDSDGQVNFGDGSNYIKYYREEDGTYRLAISASEILYDLNGSQHSIADISLIGEYVRISTYEGEPCIELGESDSDFRLIITNTRIQFMEGTSVPAYINNQSLVIKKAVVEEELHQGGFVWKVRSNGNLGLMWMEATD